MVIGRKKTRHAIKLEDDLEQVNKFKHLGFIIRQDRKLKMKIKERKRADGRFFNTKNTIQY